MGGECKDRQRIVKRPPHLNDHLKGEHASEDIVKVAQDLQGRNPEETFFH